MQSVRLLAELAKNASTRLALLSTAAKNGLLEKIADAIDEHMPDILSANKKDLAEAKKKELGAGLIDRLMLNETRLKNIASDVRAVARLKDFIGDTIESRELENGLFLKRVRVPIGVIGMIYEARPNVTVDAAVLCLKSGNAVILKSGSDAINSSRALVKIMQDVLAEASGLKGEIPLQDSVQLIDSTDRKTTQELLELHGLVDVIIPRGSKGLIDFVRENATVPIIETGASVVHVYVHEDANVKKAAEIVLNSKLRRISICNTLDSLLLHHNVAEKFLHELVKALEAHPYNADHLELRADEACTGLLKKIPKPKNFELTLKKSTDADYATEFLDYILAVKTVRGVDEAIEHITHYSLKHTEAIVTENADVAEKFLTEVDAACVYWNASTQFSDGGQFGLGAEIGISTQKLHVRGPFALEGLTTYKWRVEGNGQVRNP